MLAGSEVVAAGAAGTEGTTPVTSGTSGRDEGEEERPEPEVPAWARDEPASADDLVPAPGSAPHAPPPPSQHDDQEASGHASLPAGPVRPEPTDRLDLSALAGLAGDLAAVEHALEALDAGTPERSPLLVELLGPARPTGPEHQTGPA